MKNGAVLLLSFALTFFSCEKDHAGNRCERLADGIVANNVDEVKAAVNNAIDKLHNKEHTAANLSSLATLLSSRCGLRVEVLCVGCIYTDPAQSEIRISANSAGTSITKVIDITYTASNIMVFRSMHD